MLSGAIHEIVPLHFVLRPCERTMHRMSSIAKGEKAVFQQTKMTTWNGNIAQLTMVRTLDRGTARPKSQICAVSISSLTVASCNWTCRSVGGNVIAGDGLQAFGRVLHACI